MKHVLLALSLLALVVLVAARPDGPKSTRKNVHPTTTQDQESVNEGFDLRCGENGEGEIIQLTGYIHHIYHFSENGNTSQLHRNSNYGGLIGIGLASGEIYRVNGATSIRLRANKGRFDQSITENFVISGPGRRVNASIHRTVRLRMEPGSQPSTEVLHVDVECK